MKKLTITLGLLIALGMTSCYDFDREQQEKDADTRMIEAETSAKTKLIEANAKSKAIEVVGNALKNNPEYLKFQMIEGMYRYKSDKTIYVPTEANLPIILK